MKLASLFKLAKKKVCAEGSDARNARKSGKRLGSRSVDQLQIALWLAAEPEHSEEREKLIHELESQMAMVPAGTTRLKATGFEAPQLRLQADLDAFSQEIAMDTFFVDRYTVTNQDFSKFVDDGGYHQMEHWPQDVWPSVLQFVDQTGLPGPRYWQQGKPLRNKLTHPVVGICWHEAMAYARWCGKILPSTAQWQWSASWASQGESLHGEQKYPWGNTFQSHLANTWGSEINDTVEVNEYYDGATKNGVYQLIGNIWEWVNTRYIHNDDQSPYFAEIRGGAFDSYFESQTTNFFRSGLPVFHRCPNVGFRCAAALDDLEPTSRE